MKIKMITMSAGPDGNLHPGALADMPEKQARELIAGGYAVAVAEKPEAVKKQAEKEALKVETATLGASENAALGTAAKKDVAKPTGKA